MPAEFRTEASFIPTRPAGETTRDASETRRDKEEVHLESGMDLGGERGSPPPISRVNTMRKGSLTLLVSGLALASLLLWQQVQAVRVGYEAGQMRRQMRRQAVLNEGLRVELARLNAPQRLAQDAESRLGMSRPDPESQIHLGRPALRADGHKILSFLWR